MVVIILLISSSNSLPSHSQTPPDTGTHCMSQTATPGVHSLKESHSFQSSLGTCMPCNFINIRKCHMKSALSLKIIVFVKKKIFNTCTVHNSHFQPASSTSLMC